MEACFGKYGCSHPRICAGHTCCPPSLWPANRPLCCPPIPPRSSPRVPEPSALHLTRPTIQPPRLPHSSYAELCSYGTAVASAAHALAPSNTSQTAEIGDSLVLGCGQGYMCDPAKGCPIRVCMPKGQWGVAPGSGACMPGERGGGLLEGGV